MRLLDILQLTGMMQPSACSTATGWDSSEVEYLCTKSLSFCSFVTFEFWRPKYLMSHKQNNRRAKCIWSHVVVNPYQQLKSNFLP